MIWASSSVAEADESFVKRSRRTPGGGPANASRTCSRGTWSRTARRSWPSRSPRSSNATRSDKDGLLTAGVGKGESSVVVEAAEPLGHVGLGRLGVVEAEGAEPGEPVAEGLGRRGRQ